MLWRVYYKVSGVVTERFFPGITHKLVAVVEAYHQDDIYRNMQAEIWSPNGEARELIYALGLHHTSMSVGDVVVASDGRVLMCSDFEWKAVKIEEVLHV